MNYNLLMESWRKYTIKEAPEGCSENTFCNCVDSSINISVEKIQQFLANKYGKELMQKTFEERHHENPFRAIHTALLPKPAVSRLKSTATCTKKGLYSCRLSCPRSTPKEGCH